MNNRTIPTIAALFLLGMGVFFAGMWTTYQDWQPWQLVTQVQAIWRSVRATGEIQPERSFTRRYHPAERYVVADPAAVSPGLLAINRYDPVEKSYVLDLMDETGKVLHTRRIDYSKLVAGGPPKEFVHIATVLPDGSALVAFDDATALARLDACGDPIWALTDQVYHHSIKPGDDGYWTWQSAVFGAGLDQRMVRFDPETGKILESIDLIDDVIGQSDANAIAMLTPKGFEFNRSGGPGEVADLFHPNDVEPLRASMAAAFPQFTTGDLLVSMRNMNMLAVIDRKTYKVLWAQYGPWHRQHDADFQPDGTITVFSNNTERYRSSIFQVDPKTGAVVDLFRASDLDFDSGIMGKQQRMATGNWLITSPMEGRVIEVSATGKMVREFNNILNAQYNSIVPYAEYLAPGYLKSIPVCTK